MKKTAIAFSLLFTFLTTFSRAESIKHLAVGDKIPEAVMRLESGQEVGLEEQMAGEPAVLIFYRGGWCPFCTKHLAALNDITEELADAGVALLAISPDRPAKLKAAEKLADIDYVLLSDSKMELAQAFGITFRLDDKTFVKYRDQYGIDIEGDSGETHHLLPHPSVFVVDAEGIIQFAHVDSNYRKRLAPEKVLKAVREVVTGAH
jgi:peroxiredoxin